MNFFGHAVVASWMSVDARIGLGAMLPDLEAMIGGNATVGDPLVARGVNLHHRTDAVFHELPAFCDLCRETTALLRNGGIRRGPARGVAHVAVEICLDSWLANDTAGTAMYVASLEASDTPDLRWQSPSDAHRFSGLMARLADAGPPRSEVDPHRVAYRIARALSRRPLLALTAYEEENLHIDIPTISAAVHHRAPALVAALRRDIHRHASSTSDIGR